MGRLSDRERSRLKVAWALMALASLMTALGVGSQIGPDLRAAHGQGTRGTWVAEQYVCDKAYCSWQGDFFLPNGTEARRDIQLTGGPPAYRGLRIPALISGGADVYPAHGSRQWIQDTIVTVVGGVAFIVLGGGWFYVWLRRIRS